MKTKKRSCLLSYFIMMKITAMIPLVLLPLFCLGVRGQDTLSAGGMITVVDPPPGEVGGRKQPMERLKSICRRCQSQSCILGVPNDCGAYVVCDVGHDPSQMRCPFGTFFRENEGCLYPSVVKCPSDPCSDPEYPNLESYRDFRIKEPNCRYYWRCNGMYSTAECCPEGEAYHSQKKECVKDTSCNATCPRHQSSQKKKDNNIETVCNGDSKRLRCQGNMEVQINDVFWGRSNKKTCGPVRFLPKPCVSSTPLETIRNQCAGKRSCIVKADSALYKDPCPKVKKYLQVDYICKPGCNLKSKDGITFYNEASVSQEQKCPQGTRFDSTACTCITSGQTAPLCKLQVLIKFDNETGPEVTNVAEFPVYIEPKAIKKMNGYGIFLGNGSIKIPFYSGNDNLARTFGIQIRLFAMIAGPRKQVLLTNCKNDTFLYPDAVSLEIYLNNTRTGSFVHIRIVNTDGSVTMMQLPIKLKEWTNVIFEFDGTFLHGTLQYMKGGDIQEERDRVRFSGHMATSGGPMKIGSCTKFKDGLYGYVDEIQISFCKDTVALGSSKAP